MSAQRTASSGAAWIVTFGDLAALLLTFFVLTYSMSDLELPRPPDLAVWSDQLAVDSAIVAGEVSDRSSESEAAGGKTSVYVRSLARDAIERAGLTAQATTAIAAGGVEIRVGGIAWEDPASLEVLAGLIGRLDQIARLANRTLVVETGGGGEIGVAPAIDRGLALITAGGASAVVGVRPTLAATSVLCRLEPAG